MLRVVVTFAVQSEFAAWRRFSRFDSMKGSAGSIYLMRTGDAEVYAVLTGIGMRSVPDEFQNLLAKSADLCIASGLAGSLKKKYSAGTILVANAVRTSGPDRAIQSDKSLVDRANQCGAASVDFFLTSGAVVNSSPEKLRLGKMADAVEMESFDVLRLAMQYGVPAVAVRAVSDGAERSLPMDFNRIIDDRGRITWSRAFYEILRRPARVPQTIRFGFDSSRAARNLVHFLDRYIQFLIGCPQPSSRVFPSERDAVLGAKTR